MTKAGKVSAPALDAKWLAVDATGAVSALMGAGAQAEALVAEWVKRGNADAVAEAAEHGQGPARKAARRGLGVLKSRGVSVPERRKVATLTARGAETLEASMVPPDGNGTLLLLFQSRAQHERGRVAFVILADSGLLLRVDPAELTPAQTRDALTRLVPTGYRPVPVPLEWARWRVAAARRLHSERKVPEPLGLTTAAPLLEPSPDQEPPHPFEEEGLVLADEDAAAMSKASAGLHLLPEFRGWVPQREALDELLAEVGATLTPGEQPDPEVVGQRLQEQIDAATDRWFSPQRREGLLRAMRDSALAVLAREGEQKALEVVAVMTLIEKAGLITDPPREIPFLRAFFEKGVSILMAQNGGQLRVPVRATPAGAAPESHAP